VSYFDLHGTIRRAFTDSRTWNERPIAKTEREAVDRAFLWYCRLNKIPEGDSLGQVSGRRPFRSDAIREGMLSSLSIFLSSHQLTGSISTLRRFLHCRKLRITSWKKLFTV
jgi:hypothetical protein